MNRLPIFINELNYKKKLKINSFNLIKTSFILKLSNIFEKYGYILKYKTFSLNNKFKIYLSFTNNTKPVFQLINCIFKINRALSYSYLEIVFLKKKSNYGVFFFSTNKGILSDIDCIKKKTGGILIFWIF